MEQRREAPNVPPRARNGSGNSGSRLEDARQYRTDVDALTPIDLKAFSATPTWRSEKKNKAYSPLAHLQRGSGAAVPRRAISVSGMFCVSNGSLFRRAAPSEVSAVTSAPSDTVFNPSAASRPPKLAIACTSWPTLESSIEGSTAKPPSCQSSPTRSNATRSNLFAIWSNQTQFIPAGALVAV